MKNIHLLPTDKGQRITKTNKGTFLFCSVVAKDFIEIRKDYSGFHLYITNDEEIKEGDWFITTDTNEIHKSDWIKFHFDNGKKIILTTDQDLIADDVQSINDTFLEWFVKNPSCEEVCTIKNVHNYEEYRSYFDYKIIIPQEKSKQECKDCLQSLEICTCIEDTIDISDHDGIGNAVDNLNNEPPQETIEDAAESYADKWNDLENQFKLSSCFIAGANYQAEKMYSEEDLRESWHNGMKSDNGFFGSFEEWFQQFKK